MRFLIDESVDYPLAVFLTDHGHDVVTIAVDYPASLSDDAVLALAQHDARVLITYDRDFGELVFRRGLPHSGVILFRLSTLPLARKQAILMQVLKDYHDRLDQFVVVSIGGVRVRRQPPRHP